HTHTHTHTHTDHHQVAFRGPLSAFQKLRVWGCLLGLSLISGSTCHPSHAHTHTHTHRHTDTQTHTHCLCRGARHPPTHATHRHTDTVSAERLVTPLTQLTPQKKKKCA